MSVLWFSTFHTTLIIYTYNNKKKKEFVIILLITINSMIKYLYLYFYILIVNYMFGGTFYILNKKTSIIEYSR